ncbi:hypothetical protein ACTXT7_004793 [Hymenolepis weldensis]
MLAYDLESKGTSVLHQMHSSTGIIDSHANKLNLLTEYTSATFANAFVNTRDAYPTVNKQMAFLEHCQAKRFLYPSPSVGSNFEFKESNQAFSANGHITFYPPASFIHRMPKDRLLFSRRIRKILSIT